MDGVWEAQAEALARLTVAVQALPADHRRHLDRAVESVQLAFKRARQAYAAALAPMDVADSRVMALAVAAAGRQHVLAVRLEQLSDQLTILGISAPADGALARIRAMARGLAAGTLPV